MFSNAQVTYLHVGVSMRERCVCVYVYLDVKLREVSELIDEPGGITARASQTRLPRSQLHRRREETR